MKNQVFISSPSNSLIEERKLVYEILTKMGFKNIFCSETDRSRDTSSYLTCLKEVKNSSLFILLLGQYYGWVPENERISVTEMEYNKACELGIDILVFRLQYFDYEKLQNEFISRVENFYSGKFRGKLIAGTDELEKRILSDINQHYVVKSEANTLAPLINVEESEIVIKYQETKSIPLHCKKDLNKLPLLKLKARINYGSEAGNAQLMKLIFNNYVLKENNLINKPNKFILKDQRERFWFNDQKQSWSLPYSPNFKSNYFDIKYKIINGDPYTLIFSLPENLFKKKKNILNVIHIGTEEHEAFKNSIIISQVELF